MTTAMVLKKASASRDSVFQVNTSTKKMAAHSAQLSANNAIAATDAMSALRTQSSTRAQILVNAAMALCATAIIASLILSTRHRAMIMTARPSSATQATLTTRDRSPTIRQASSRPTEIITLRRITSHAIC